MYECLYVTYRQSTGRSQAAEIWYRGYLDTVNVMTAKLAASEVTGGNFI